MICVAACICARDTEIIPVDCMGTAVANGKTLCASVSVIGIAIAKGTETGVSAPEAAAPWGVSGGIGLCGGS